MAASLLEELLGLKTNKAPSNPWEATEPTTKRDQHDAANPLVGASAAPTPPPTTDTLAVRQVEAEERWKQIVRLDEHLYGFQLALEKQNALHQAEVERNQDHYDNARIPSGAPGAYVVRRFNRRFARLWVTAYEPVQLVVPGTGQPVPRMMRPGWNTLDVPEGTRIYTTGAAFDATYCASETPSNPEIDKAVSGYVSNNVNGTTSIGTDSPFLVVCGHWFLQNNTAASLQWEVDQATNVASPVLAAGASLSSDVPITVALHLLTAAAQPVNTTGSNIVFRAWN